MQNDTNKSTLREDIRQRYIEDPTRPSMDALAAEYGMPGPSVRRWAADGTDDPLGQGLSWRKQRDRHWARVAMEMQQDRSERYVAVQGDLDDATLGDLRRMITAYAARGVAASSRAAVSDDGEVVIAEAMKRIAEAISLAANALEVIRTPGLSARDALLALAGKSPEE